MKPRTPPSLTSMNASPGRLGTLGAGARLQRGDVGREVDQRPVPEAVRGRGVGVVAGDGVALRALRCAAPRQLGRRVAGLGDLVVLERLAVGHVVAGDGERRDLRQQVVRVGLHGTVETHLRSWFADVVGRSNLPRPPLMLGPSVDCLSRPRFSKNGRPSRARPDRPIMEPMDDHPPYPSGLRLAGRRVVVVGGGQVAQRRIPGLLAAGADVVVVSPRVTPAIEGQVLAGEVAWVERGFADEDLADTWYVIAATDDPDVNEQVSKAAEVGAGVLRPLRRRHERDGLDPGGRSVRRADARRARAPRATAYGGRPRRDRHRAPRGDRRRQRAQALGARRHPGRRRARAIPT